MGGLDSTGKPGVEGIGLWVYKFMGLIFAEEPKGFMGL
jgi:hypothetical protein